MNETTLTGIFLGIPSLESSALIDAGIYIFHKLRFSGDKIDLVDHGGNTVEIQTQFRLS